MFFEPRIGTPRRSGNGGVRMWVARQSEQGSRSATIESIADKIGCTGETLRKWREHAE